MDGRGRGLAKLGCVFCGARPRKNRDIIPPLSNTSQVLYMWPHMYVCSCTRIAHVYVYLHVHTCNRVVNQKLDFNFSFSTTKACNLPPNSFTNMSLSSFSRLRSIFAISNALTSAERKDTSLRKFSTWPAA